MAIAPSAQKKLIAITATTKLRQHGAAEPCVPASVARAADKKHARKHRTEHIAPKHGVIGAQGQRQILHCRIHQRKNADPRGGNGKGDGGAGWRFMVDSWVQRIRLSPLGTLPRAEALLRPVCGSWQVMPWPPHPFPWIDALIILALIALNGVFAMSELAIVSARSARLQAMADNGSSGAAAALRLARDPGKFLSTVQIGITLIGIIAGAYSGASLGQTHGRTAAGIGVERGLGDDYWFSAS